MGPCPDEERIAAFSQGRLDAAERGAVESHLDGCSACSRVVADLVRIFSDGGPDRPSGDDALASDELLSATEGDGESGDDAELLQVGSSIGRYRVLDCVGMGGMGVVYAAYDPELDRRVAVKLLRRDDRGSDDARSARLVREAQSLAKLTHPNVITVHDVGTWNEQVFVAMEFVDGGTLKSWMRTGARTWPQIRDVLVAAGRGLAAAHAAGLVHRDFKPDNVLIGSDGRVRVTDFGLARWEDHVVSTANVLSAGGSWDAVSEGPPSGEVLPGGLELSLTRTGTLVGTPAYMAPEQYEQKVADAVTDQFSYCVVMFEALYGRRPFEGKTLAELAAQVVSGPALQFPSSSSVPRRVKQLLRRGLSRTPRERFGSMNDLLAILERRSARRWQLAVAVVVPASILGVGLWAYASRVPEPDFCREDGIASQWNGARRRAVEEAFGATGVGHADETLKRTLVALDTYAGAWEAAWLNSCDDGGDDGPAVAALRARCLSERREAFDAVLEGFEQADVPMVARAIGAVSALPSAEGCVDTQALFAELPPPPPPELRQEVEGLRRELARVKGLMAAGRYDEGLRQARDIDARAATLEHRPLRADTQLQIGSLLDRMGEAEPALAAFEESELLATAARHHRTTARALINQVYVLGGSLGRVGEARRVATRAEAELEASDALPTERAALLLNRATTEVRAGELIAAESLAERALALRDRETEPMRWADSAFNLASIRLGLGRVDRALEPLTSYLEIFEDQLGRMHPEVAVGYETLAVCLRDLERYPESRVAFETAVEIELQTRGPDHPRLAATLTGLARLDAAEGNYDAALANTRRAIAIRDASGTDETMRAENELDVAHWLSEQGDDRAAQAQLDLAFETMTNAMGTETVFLSPHHSLQAAIAARAGQTARARASSERSIALLVETFGDDHPMVWETRLAWPRLLATMERTDEAISETRTLLARMEGADAGLQAFATRFFLAELLVNRPGGRTEALALARAARAGFEQEPRRLTVAEIDRWLQEHAADAD